MPVADDTTGGTTGAARGFILQASYRIRDGAPVVHLYGVLEGGGTFLVRDRREAPHFYIRREDAARARDLGAARQRDTARRTFDGGPVVRVEVAVPPDTPPLRDRLQEHGIRTFEAARLARRASPAAPPAARPPAGRLYRSVLRR